MHKSVHDRRYFAHGLISPPLDNPEQIIPNSELRQMYIPELVLNLHQVLFETHDLLPGCVLHM